ncbi:Fe-S cluster assembly scaffold SufA [Candidatus Liberibacter asiaticus]|uniref:FeS assembly scaffold SufA n=3 Tax=Liberibacter asiaticus TaxID=34021 RepID=C6XGN4_LIBAP|nr:Fe-S cluster assembly scaffold SufA [Candidatus Liberibacter asiaticus]ACT57537.1 FeS assembly scaffold SufA [Candidatus Liberibacter asiaticus str. psy62]AGH17300.1 FeS assembly scaffold SufA [Candidatus Liberibacter asiaticus str. gxpsy]ALK07588.1 Fe-S cluster assembly scaffold SufA [Candidatus Liberibacter asiaticus]ASK53079.1 Fe-S cluster assembly scaffold SufA [Candidatus Liberibacter asiaticus]AWL14403.1 Fe-S cluster assembly scaffold SufA [Candidatus Liberibacter asiaticus]
MSDIVTMTEAAVYRIKEIVFNSQGKAQGIRISLKKGGCAGLEYMVDLVTDNPVDGDDLIEKDGVKVWIDSASLLYMLGTEIDFKTEKLYSGFVFHNPNQVSACGCGQSVEIKRADL